MSRIPQRVINRNRQSSFADEQASGYSVGSRGQYMLQGGSIERPVSVELGAFIRENDLTPAERRRLCELQPGDEIRLGGGAAPVFILRCIVRATVGI